MEKRVLLAFVLSFLVILGWEMIVSSRRSPEQKQQQEPKKETQASVDAASSLAPSAVGSFVTRSPETPHLEQLSNAFLQIQVTNAEGGGISSVKLNQFWETSEKKNLYQLFAMEKSGPLFRIIGPPAFGCYREAPRFLKSSDESIQLAHSCGERGTIEASFRLNRDNPYVVDIRFNFSNLRDVVGEEFWVTFSGSTVHRKHREGSHGYEWIYDSGDHVNRISTASLSDHQLPSKAVQWLAFGDRYFVIAALPPDIFRPILEKESRTSQPTTSQNFIMKHEISKTTLEKDIVLRVFLGPKDPDMLSGLGNVEQVVDFGIFRLIASPIYSFLKFTYEHLIPNYGIAIVLLTILMRLLFLPLTLKGMGNMQAMQKIQPEIQKLKEKYSDDRQQLNREMMALFKAHRINPIGGCLPMLIQLPVFFALYAVLDSSVDLYQAPFLGWIRDLSDKDPYYVLPILFGASFLVQQKLTPSTADPTTQKIMLIMPVIVTFFMLHLPSGLNLYILTSTVLGVIQQLIMNKRVVSVASSSEEK